jgi:hypothetical protein
MKAYFENDYVTLYQGNCLDYADVITGADILITDPPYGMAYVSNSSLNGPSKEIAGDNDVNLRNNIIELWRGGGGNCVLSSQPNRYFLVASKLHTTRSKIYSRQIKIWKSKKCCTISISRSYYEGASE